MRSVTTVSGLAPGGAGVHGVERAGTAPRGVFDAPDFDGHEQIVHFCDLRVGLRAIVAIHSTVLGPALGGTRRRSYPTDAAALADALRLARGMTYKSALAGVDLGGGKAVILAGGESVPRDRLYRAFGRCVDRLGGRFVTGEDVGTNQADVDAIRRGTRHVVGVSEELGGLGPPSGSTARGVLGAIRAAVEARWGTRDLAGCQVAVMGAGKVGSALVDLLAGARCRITIADPDARAIERVRRRVADVAVVSPDGILSVECDVLAPCALGRVLSFETIPALRCAIVAGSANDQLAEPRDAARLAERGIVYVPDYAANAGGLIQVATEYLGGDLSTVHPRVARIEHTCRGILAAAAAAGVTTAEAAARLAERRLRTAAAAA